jgi:hypothetical protein
VQVVLVRVSTGVGTSVKMEVEGTWKFAGVCAWTTGAPRITVEMIAMSGRDFFNGTCSRLSL